MSGLRMTARKNSDRQPAALALVLEDDRRDDVIKEDTKTGG